MLVAYRAVDVQGESAGYVTADFDFSFSLITAAGFHVLLLLVVFLVLSLYSVFFLVSSFSFTVFCLSIRFKIIKFFFYFKEIKEEGLMYRALVCQVGTPTGEDTVLKGTGGFSQLLLNWERSNTCS